MAICKVARCVAHYRDPYPVSLHNHGTFALSYDAVPFDYDRCYVHCATRTRLSTRNPLIGSGVGLPGFNSPDVPSRESGSSYAPPAVSRLRTKPHLQQNRRKRQTLDLKFFFKKNAQKDLFQVSKKKKKYYE